MKVTSRAVFLAESSTRDVMVSLIISLPIGPRSCCGFMTWPSTAQGIGVFHLCEPLGGFMAELTVELPPRPFVERSFISRLLARSVPTIDR
jgi:hypothetical protein